MSSGSPVTPVGGGFIRQRHSQGYASSGDDLEDDACSKFTHPLPTVSRNRTWIDILENALWIASAVFIVYFGDQHKNLIYLLWHDERIRRMPLYLGTVLLVLNVIIFFYTSMLAWGARRFGEKWDISNMSALPFAILLGLISFCLFSFALWPIWSFLTLPLLFTLFMACMVMFPYIIFGTFKPQTDLLRID